MKITRRPGNARMSDAVIAGEMVYLKGVIPVDLSGDITAQTQDVLARIDALLTACNSGKDRLVSATIWLRDMADFDKMNAVYDSWLIAGAEPVRACVEARMSSPLCRVEIQVTAVL